MRERSLRLSLFEAFLSSLMIGAGETYLPAYSLSIGMGEVFAGILATMPIFSGAFLQLTTPRGLQRVQSHKHWVVASSLLQALTFIPLIYFSATRVPNFWTLFFILTLYWGAGFSSGLGWNYWMGRLVQIKEGHRFFSKRAQISQVGTLLGLLGGGVALHNKVEIGPFSSVFTLIFIFAGSCRLISTFILSSQYFDPAWKSDPRLGFRDSWKVFWANTQKRKFFFFLAPFQAAIFISSPFVTPYFLAQVKLDYGSYMTAIGLLFVGKMVALMLIERFRGHTSGFSLLLFGAGAIVPLPSLWILSKSVYYIFGLQLVNGLAWAFVEVGLALIFFNDLKQEEKIPILTVYNLLNSLAIIIGTCIGARLLIFFGESISSYYAIFVVGSVLRGFGFIPLYRYMKAQLLKSPNPSIRKALEKVS
ncbi:MAG: MFS transporter [Pseudobdellovibrionaceae bacterium]